ncbi:MAG TPA: hypothetical protein VGM37_07790 [Armatimonadota bacterium]|jgi:prepilin-type processing-associated H-X9-DG protein
MSSYGYLGYGWPPRYGRIGGFRTTVVRSPTLAVLANELRPWHDEGRAGAVPMDSPGLVNVLYCDGHVAQRTRVEWGNDAIMGVAR